MVDTKQILAALEIGDGSIKLCVGEKYEDKICIYQTFVENISSIQNGNIIDENALIESLTKVISNAKRHIPSLTLENVVYSLPSNDLLIYQTQATGRTANGYDIKEEDIKLVKDSCKSLRGSSRALHVDEDREIIDVIPVEYYLSNGNKFFYAPIGERSETIKLQCSILTLPKDLVNLYRAILQRVGINSSSYYIAPIANYEAIKNEINNDNVIVIDIGLKNTTCSVFVAGKLRNTFQIPSGSYQMTRSIEQELGVDFMTAEELKIKFGSCYSNQNVKSSVYKRSSGKYISDVAIRKIIEKHIDNILDYIKDKLRDVLNQFTFNIVACGGGSHLIDIDKKLSEYFGMESIHYIPTCLGIRHSSYSVISGLLEICKDKPYIDRLARFTTRENKIAENLDKEIIVDKQINLMENNKRDTSGFGAIFDPEDFK